MAALTLERISGSATHSPIVLIPLILPRYAAVACPVLRVKSLRSTYARRLSTGVMPAMSGTGPTNELRSTSHSKYSSTATSRGTSQRTGGTMRSTAASGKPTWAGTHAATSGSSWAITSSLSWEVARRPFSHAMMLRGFSTPAAFLAARPLAIVGATNLSIRRPTAVVMMSASAISLTASELPELTALTPLTGMS